MNGWISNAKPPRFPKPPAVVPCYALKDVLTTEQWAAVEPFARETFSETWRAIMNTPGEASYQAQTAINDAQDEAKQICLYFGIASEEIERALYAWAMSRGLTPVLGPARRVK